jgi:ATP-binding protein involved in chromosome partitioning
MDNLTALDPKLQTALRQIIYPDFSLDLLTMGIVQEASLNQGLARIILRPLSAPQEKIDRLKKQIEAALLKTDGISQVSIEWPDAPRSKSAPAPIRLNSIQKIIAIGSCKGGVGKSTLTVNLARCLQSMGHKTGLLDLDINGPSLPAILRTPNAAIEADRQGHIIPLTLPDGLKALSLGFMTAPEQALVWRGPMLIKLVRQMLYKTAWDKLDFLLIDLPPGTGDVQISLLRHITLDGIIVVSTPQEASLSDTIRGISMLQRNQAPIWGLLENMSYFICPSCQNIHYIFGRDTVAELARRTGLKFLGQIPFDPDIQSLDLHSANYDKVIKPYYELARQLAEL